MDIVVDIHGLMRWGVLAAAAVGLIHFLLTFPRSAAGPSRLNRILASVYLGLMDIQLLLGVVILIGVAQSRSSGIPHALIMLAAVVLAHILRARSRKVAPPAQARLMAAFFVGPLMLILAGLALQS